MQKKILYRRIIFINFCFFKLKNAKTRLWYKPAFIVAGFTIRHLIPKCPLKSLKSKLKSKLS